MNEIKTTVNPVGVADYEERKQAKIDRLQERAQKAREQGAQMQDELLHGHDFAYWTQPIHNTSAGRAFERQRERVRSRFEKGMEVIQTATDYEDRAEAMATNHAISSDDPEAIAKLQAKIDELEKGNEVIKDFNKYWRKHRTAEGWTCKAYPEETEEFKKAVSEEIAYLQESRGWTLEEIQSLTRLFGTDTAEIRRCRERIEEIQSRAELVGWMFDGGEVIANKSEDRYQIIFDEIPDEETRTALKKSGFKWSRKNGAWQRMLNKNTLREMRYYLPFLRPVEEDKTTPEPTEEVTNPTEKNSECEELRKKFIADGWENPEFEKIGENRFKMVSNGIVFDKKGNMLYAEIECKITEIPTTPEPTKKYYSVTWTSPAYDGTYSSNIAKAFSADDVKAYYTSEGETVVGEPTEMNEIEINSMLRRGMPVVDVPRMEVATPEPSEPKKTVFNVHYIKDTMHYVEAVKAFSENDIQKYYDSMNADVIIIATMEENDVPTVCKVLDIPPAETVAEPDNTPEPEPTPNETPVENDTAVISAVRGLLMHLLLIPLNDCYTLPEIDSTDNTPTKTLKALFDEIADSEEEEDGGEWVKPAQPSEPLKMADLFNATFFGDGDKVGETVKEKTLDELYSIQGDRQVLFKPCIVIHALCGLFSVDFDGEKLGCTLKVCKSYEDAEATRNKFESMTVDGFKEYLNAPPTKPTEPPTPEPPTEPIEPPKTAVQSSVVLYHLPKNTVTGIPDEKQAKNLEIISNPLEIYFKPEKTDGTFKTNFWMTFYKFSISSIREIAKMAEYSDQTHGTNNVEIMLETALYYMDFAEKCQDMARYYLCGKVLSVLQKTAPETEKRNKILLDFCKKQGGDLIADYSTIENAQFVGNRFLMFAVPEKIDGIPKKPSTGLSKTVEQLKAVANDPDKVRLDLPSISALKKYITSYRAQEEADGKAKQKHIPLDFGEGLPAVSTEQLLMIMQALPNCEVFAAGEKKALYAVGSDGSKCLLMPLKPDWIPRKGKTDLTPFEPKPKKKSSKPTKATGKTSVNSAVSTTDTAVGNPETEKPVDPVKRFEVGKVYGTTLLTSSDCLITFRVVKRSKCFVWLEDRHGEIEKRKIRVHEWYTANNAKIQAESCDPLGQYSMSPRLDATDILEYATPKEAREAFDRERVIHATVGNVTIAVDTCPAGIPQF